MYFEKRKALLIELGFNEKSLPLLKNYIDFLWESNEELNLISRKMTYEELIDNHLIDCLLPLSHFPKNAKAVADFGTGGGLPGVLYALQFPDTTFHLFEKSTLKQDFLKNCKKITPNLIIRGEIPKDLRDIDMVIARAFKPLDVLLEMSSDYYMRGGKYFLLKARKEKIDEELLLARKKFKDLEAEVIPLQSPVLEVERHLLKISKRQ